MAALTETDKIGQIIRAAPTLRDDVVHLHSPYPALVVGAKGLLLEHALAELLPGVAIFPWHRLLPLLLLFVRKIIHKLQGHRAFLPFGAMCP